MFRLPLFHYAVVEYTFVPKAVDGILCSLGKILTKYAANVLHLHF